MNRNFDYYKQRSWSLGQGISGLVLKNEHEVSSSKFALFRAAQSGDVNMIQSLISAGTDPNERKPETRETPLLVAAKFGQVAAIDRLLCLGAEPNQIDYMGRTALMIASHQGEIHSVKTILKVCKHFEVDKKNQSGNTALLLAVSACSHSDYLLTIEALIEAGADVNAKNNLSFTPLTMSINHDHFGIEAMKILIQSGARLSDVDSFGDTILHHAARQGKLNILEYVLQLATNLIDVENHCGNTPLFEAVRHNQKTSTKVLLSSGANPNVISGDGNHILNIAAGLDEIIVQILLNFRSDPNFYLQFNNSQCHSPLIEAVESFNTKTVRLLLDSGVDPNAELGGIHVLNIAASNSLESVRLLLGAGSSPKLAKPYLTKRFISLTRRLEFENFSDCEPVFSPVDIAVLHANFCTAFFLMFFVGCRPTFYKVASLDKTTSFSEITKGLMWLALTQSNLDANWQKVFSCFMSQPTRLSLLCSRKISMLFGYGKERKKSLFSCGLPARLVKELLFEDFKEEYVFENMNNVLQSIRPTVENN